MPANTEETFYGNLVQSRIALPGGYPKDSPAGNARVARVTGTYGGGIKIGPAIALKVMAGDKFNVQVNSWYKIPQGQSIPPPSGIISYFELGKINLALNEINRFCKENTPKLYKITIKELNDNLHNFNKIEKAMILDIPYRQGNTRIR